MAQNPSIFTAWGWNPTGDFGALTIYTAKNKKPIMFLKAPPTKPPTPRQVFQRDTFRYIAKLWKNLTHTMRETWELAAKRARLSITGYDLFVYYQTTKDIGAIRTVEHQAGVTLIA